MPQRYLYLQAHVVHTHTHTDNKYKFWSISQWYNWSTGSFIPSLKIIIITVVIVSSRCILNFCFRPLLTSQQPCFFSKWPFISLWVSEFSDYERKMSFILLLKSPCQGSPCTHFLANSHSFWDFPQLCFRQLSPGLHVDLFFFPPLFPPTSPSQKPPPPTVCFSLF